MAWESKNALFKSLDDEEEKKFRDHARQADPPEGTPWSILHPVCVEEWYLRGLTPPGEDEAR